MMQFYLKYKKTILYLLAIIAIVVGFLLPEDSAAKGICFGFAAGAILIGILNLKTRNREINNKQPD
ncbi:MAG: hypothetical protein ABJB05_12780 [Parafilimonas sp.]